MATPKTYDDADLKVRSIPDGDLFEVKRECLVRGSEILRDMFACCDASRAGGATGDSEYDWEIIDFPESASQMNILFKFLHNPPDFFVSPEPTNETKSPDFTRIVQNIPEHAIPFPMIPILLGLADKYAFTSDLTDRLHSHLAAYASTYPLRVYGYAVTLGLPRIAADASMYLLHPPLASYSAEEIRAIPTAEAYHNLVLLHDVRVKKLREMLEESEIFPHGYGECPRHAHRTKTLWDSRKETVSGGIQAATDVAAEMALVTHEIADCQACSKACIAAVAMLGYKCGKLPRRVDQIPK